MLSEVQEETLCEALATSEQQLADLSTEMEAQTAKESELKQKESDVQSKKQSLAFQIQTETECLDHCAATLDRQYTQHQTELKSSISSLQGDMATLKQTLQSSRSSADALRR